MRDVNTLLKTTPILGRYFRDSLKRSKARIVFDRNLLNQIEHHRVRELLRPEGFRGQGPFFDGYGRCVEGAVIRTLRISLWLLSRLEYISSELFQLRFSSY